MCLFGKSKSSQNNTPRFSQLVKAYDNKAANEAPQRAQLYNERANAAVGNICDRFGVYWDTPAEKNLSDVFRRAYFKTDTSLDTIGSIVMVTMSCIPNIVPTKETFIEYTHKNGVKLIHGDKHFKNAISLDAELSNLLIKSLETSLEAIDTSFINDLYQEQKSNYRFGEKSFRFNYEFSAITLIQKAIAEQNLASDTISSFNEFLNQRAKTTGVEEIIDA